MTNKNHFVFTLTLIMLAVVLTFEVTFFTMEMRYQRKLDELVINSITGGSSGSASKIEEMDRTFRALYIGEIDNEKLYDGIMEGYIYGSGDKYANYFSKDEFAEMASETAGEYVGIGILTTETDGYIEIVFVMPESPVKENGIVSGDIITAVEGNDVAEIGYDAAIDMLLGEEGTEVSFTVLRDGTETDYRITRRVVEELTVFTHVYEYDSTVGVVKITTFNDKTYEQFKSACDGLVASGVDKLVFDLRYNLGGTLDSVCDMLDYLLPEGPIVHTEKSTGEKQTYSSDAEALLDGDISAAVIVNGSTASAAELFTAALRDYKLAAVVGTATFGKGTVQGIFTLSDGSGFTVSHSIYKPPYSECLEGVGIVPDVVIELDESLYGKSIYKYTDAEDNQLCKAVELAGGNAYTPETDADAEIEAEIEAEVETETENDTAA